MIPFLVADSLAATADEVNLKGAIKERDGDALPGVMVTVKNAENKNVAYCISNSEGSFSISYPKSLVSGSIHFSCMGFKKLILPLASVKNSSEYILEEEAFELKEVTVKVAPISSHGDTLTYNVATFRDASDRSIEDVIRKLPGIKVADDGRIYYNGESINKFYIEGLDLFSGRYALASRNISPDDVVSVNVYENHQAKRVLKDVEYSDKAALNLKLKNKSMLRPIGYLKGGAGISSDKEALWTGELFGLTVSPKMQVLLSAKGNNSGVSYQNETGTLTESEMTERTTAGEIYPDSPFGNARISTSRYYDNRSLSTSANAIYRTGKYSTLNVTADYADDYYEYGNSQSIIYATGNNESVSVNESVDSEPHLKEAKLKINLENNSDNKYVSDKLSFASHFSDNDFHIENDRNIDQGINIRDYSLRNLFDGTFRIANHLLQFKSDLQMSATPVSRLTAIADGIGIVCQNVKGHNVRNREDFGYSWMINSRSHIGFKSSFSLEYDKLESSDNIIGATGRNDIKGYKIATATEPLYQYKFHNGMLLNVSIPMRLSNLRYRDVASGKKYPTDRADIDFKTSLSYTTQFNLKTILTAGRRSRLGGISDYVMNPIYVTYRQRNVLGSGRLNERSNWYANCNLSYRNSIEGLFSSASIMYMQATSNRLGGTVIADNDDVTTSYKSVDNRSDNLNANLSVSKKIYSWDTTFALDGSYERFSKDMMRQGDVIGMVMNSWTGHFKINSNPVGDYLIMVLDVKYSHVSQKVSKFGLDDNSNQTIVSYTLYTHPMKNLEIATQGYFSMNDVGNATSKSSLFLDAHVSYSIRSFDLQLSARNLTNTKTYSYSYVKDSDIYRYAFRLRPLELLLSLKYSF